MEHVLCREMANNEESQYNAYTKNDIIDKVPSELGADDYITKPLIQESCSRIKLYYDVGENEAAARKVLSHLDL
jgi:DNA-binding response OmpR family regulator